MDEAALKREISERCGNRIDRSLKSGDNIQVGQEEGQSVEEEQEETGLEECQDETDADADLVRLAVLAETRRRYTTKHEFLFLLYNDALEYFIAEWDGEILKKKLLKDVQSDTEQESFEQADQVDDEFSEDGIESTGLNSNDWWKLNLPDELANVKFLNGNTYNGRVSRKMMEGKGSYKWITGVQYTGDFEANEIGGKGRLEWSNGCWYEGEFFEGRPHGKGTMVDQENHCMYTGQWRMGLKHGKGKFSKLVRDLALIKSYCRYTNDGSYEGDWLLDKMEGFGVRVYATGSKYSGQLKNGLRQGTGTMVWPNGDVYRGHWNAGQMNGYGEYTWAAFFNESLTCPREVYYMGGWRDGMRDGKGLLMLNTRGGSRYFGGWLKNKKHGPGMIIGNNGEAMQADPLFLNDVLVSLSIADFRKEESEHEISWTNKIVKVTTALSIPILKPEQAPPLSYYLSRCSRMEGSRFDWLEEENRIYASLTTEMPRLWKVYNDYANLFSGKTAASDLVMSRICVWQLFRDSGLHRNGFSLAEIDRYVQRNEDARIEDPRDPFESIQIWQFIHFLIETSWQIYTVRHFQDSEEEERDASGQLAAGFVKFLEVYIFAQVGKRVGKLCNGYVDALPISSVLNFYREFCPHPVRARDLLCATCLPFGNLWLHQPSIDRSPIPIPDYLSDGVNARILPGDRIHYVRKTEQESFRSSPMFDVFERREDRLVNGLLTFRVLGVQRMTEIIRRVCPSIKEEETGLFVYADYELTFLEFYEILIEAAIELWSMQENQSLAAEKQREQEGTRSPSSLTRREQVARPKKK